MVDFVRECRRVILESHAIEGNVQVDVRVQADPVVGVPQVLRVVRGSPESDAVVDGDELLARDVPLGKHALASLLQLGLPDVDHLELPRVGRRAVDGDRFLVRVLVAVGASVGLRERRDEDAVLLMESGHVAHACVDQKLLVELSPDQTQSVFSHFEMLIHPQ